MFEPSPTNSSGKPRYITFIVYPDQFKNPNSSSELDQKMISCGEACFRSPLHDKDYFFISDTIEGDAFCSTFWNQECKKAEFVSDSSAIINDLVLHDSLNRVKPKKPHYHVIVCFEGSKTVEYGQYIANFLGAANGYFMQVRSLKSLVRYCFHLDNPEKARYDLFDSFKCNGFDFKSYLDIDKDTDLVRRYYLDMCKCITDNKILYPHKFQAFLAGLDDQTYISLYCGCLHRQINTFINSLRLEVFNKRDATISKLKKEVDKLVNENDRLSIYKHLSNLD